MVIVVSISQFRKHISDYIAQTKEGHTVILKDDRKNEQIIQLVKKKTFNPETFGAALKQASGIFTAQKHPEWRTKKDVITWVEKSRKAADRSF